MQAHTHDGLKAHIRTNLEMFAINISRSSVWRARCRCKSLYQFGKGRDCPSVFLFASSDVKMAQARPLVKGTMHGTLSAQEI
ncbi:hypothetical protein NDU88_005680 [Pleurodeles waltl]|uniref:Uncharacterized protein n=1 Tax=Pleurodeles waltl TaxID=8319 RepID=A0AAV7MBP1_PLEWA|nr:hypothetical protein NDU88_005680 [Pleurodeles waltl]